MVFEEDGTFVDTWGQGQFKGPHGVHIDAEDNIYLIDHLDHAVRKFSPGGDRLLLTLGSPDKPAPWQSGGVFNRPTDLAISPTSGDLFVSDGYGNSRVHRFRPDGTHVLSWGEPGAAPGRFSLPHNLAVLTDGQVVVCDMENHRLQAFTEEGTFLKERHMHRPMAIAVGRDGLLYVTEMGPSGVQQGVPGLGLKVVVLDGGLREVGRFGNVRGGEGHDQFIAPHGIEIDHRGDVYVAEVSWAVLGQHLDPPREVVSLRKWRRIG